MGRKISLLLFALFVVVSCSKQQPQIPSVDADNTINLTVEVSTRAVSATTTNLGEFASFGYSQGTDIWSEMPAEAIPDLMWNNRYLKSGDDWRGDIATEWPEADLNNYYAFFAYSPKATADNKMTLLTDQSTEGYQRLSYQTLANVENQVDLLVASRINQLRASRVSLAFNHALTRVGFQAFTNISNTKINSISLNGMLYKGELEVREDAVWQNVSPDKADFKVEMMPAVTVSLDPLKPTDLSLNASYCFNLLPQDLTGNTDEATCVTIDYTQNGVKYTKKHTIVNDLAKGQFTIYKVDLSGDPNADLIVAQVIITDWVFDSSSDMDTNDGDQKYEDFTATYDANGGAGVPAPEVVAANNKLTIGVAPTSNPSLDHIFLGYNTKADGTGLTYLPGDQISLTENITLYAAWDTNFTIFDNLKWAKGNLVASGANGCKIGAPEDGGLYFQFGSLIGWKGGATGDGVGRSVLGNAVFYNGAATFNAVNEASVYPTEFTQIGTIGTIWPLETTNRYYFGDNTVLSSNYDIKEVPGYIEGNFKASGVGDPCRYYLGNEWRQPTTQEIQGLYAAANSIDRVGDWWITSTNNYLIFTSVDGAKLKWPIVGCRETDGRLSNNGLYGYYSSSSVYDRTSRYYLFTDDIVAEPLSESLRHTAMPVRCVKDL